ncbi:MAG: cbb3-type cytochrome c oxidase subunit I [Solirubrobacterales bacterium]|nr:cbb3-type cytochrome c oxidase subunit I [Solirubrobacterales bacterium]
MEEQGTTRRPFMLAKGWLQAVIIVMLIGFTGLGILAARTYQAGAPTPMKVVKPNGDVLFTGDDITAGQQVFLHNGLMEYGSVFGHGAYLGPDYTADYLRRASNIVTAENGGRKVDADGIEIEGAAGEGPSPDRAREETIREFRKDAKFDEETKTLTLTDNQVTAFDQLVKYYSGFFSKDSTEYGLRKKAITDPEELRNMTAFFAWTAWAGSAERPGKNYTYTNNWPPEPRVDNTPTAEALVWSVLSLIALLGGIGLLFGAFGRYRAMGWHGREQTVVSFRDPSTVTLTPGQRATAWFFFVMAALFLIQTFVGAGVQHYRAELTSFFGFDLAAILPYNLLRIWHVQLSLFWVATSFVAAGIFLAPMIARREPRGQGTLAYALLGALAVVVFGTLIGSVLGVHHVLQDAATNWFGLQGFEYLDLARLWQILLVVGLVIWAWMLFRVLRTRLRKEHPGNMPWLFFLAACAIPAFYAVGLLARTVDNFTITEFWRFWVVHLWVEDFLEIFTTVMVAYMFVLLGVVRERIALMVILLDIALYSAGGVIGTMHHLYFSGTPSETMALGAFFSAAEVIPLTFLTVEAWSFLQLGANEERKSESAFPHRWAVMFLVSVGFWNFLGAGIFGFLINLPIVSYYEIGTALTANHGHAAMMGVYGMLAIGLALFCLRYIIPNDKWPDKWAKVSFWGTNIGLAWMCFATLFPLGIAQLYKSVSDGYFEARSLDFVTGNDTIWLIEWLRLPGDVVFILFGSIPVLYITFLGVKYAVKAKVSGGGDEGDAESELFTVVSGPALDSEEPDDGPGVGKPAPTPGT